MDSIARGVGSAQTAVNNNVVMIPGYRPLSRAFFGDFTKNEVERYAKLQDRLIGAEGDHFVDPRLREVREAQEKQTELTTKYDSFSEAYGTMAKGLDIKFKEQEEGEPVFSFEGVTAVVALAQTLPDVVENSIPFFKQNGKDAHVLLEKMAVNMQDGKEKDLLNQTAKVIKAVGILQEKVRHCDWSQQSDVLEKPDDVEAIIKMEKSPPLVYTDDKIQKLPEEMRMALAQMASGVHTTLRLLQNSRDMDDGKLVLVPSHVVDIFGDSQDEDFRKKKDAFLDFCFEKNAPYMERRGIRNPREPRPDVSFDGEIQRLESLLAEAKKNKKNALDEAAAVKKAEARKAGQEAKKAELEAKKAGLLKAKRKESDGKKDAEDTSVKKPKVSQQNSKSPGNAPMSFVRSIATDSRGTFSDGDEESDKSVSGEDVAAAGAAGAAGDAGDAAGADGAADPADPADPDDQMGVATATEIRDSRKNTEAANRSAGLIMEGTRNRRKPAPK